MGSSIDTRAGEKATRMFIPIDVVDRGVNGPLGYAVDGVTIVPGQADPLGGIRASSVKETETAFAHEMFPNNAFIAPYGARMKVGTPFKLSMFVKPIGGRQWFWMNAYDNGVGFAFAYFDLTNGVVGSIAPGMQSRIREAGEILGIAGRTGWFYVELFTDALPFGDIPPYINVNWGTADVDGGFEFAGNSNKGFYIYYPVLEVPESS